MFDEFRAVDYLASGPEVDATCLGVLGMSMGTTKAWWLAALDPRVRVCMDVCCLTDFEELIKIHNLSGHGVYYFVPSLLKHFQTAQINELIVPRARLSVNGRLDDLTPPAGVERVAITCCHSTKSMENPKTATSNCLIARTPSFPRCASSSWNGWIPIW